MTARDDVHFVADGPVAPLARADIADVASWARDVRASANGWAERAAVSNRTADLTPALDALAGVARRVESLAAVIGGDR